MTVSDRFLRSLGIAFAAGLLLGSMTPSAFAFDPAARFSLTGQLGGSSLAMGQVNDQIASARAYMRRQEWTVLDDLGGGFNYLVDVRADLFGPWMVSLGFGRFAGSTSVDFDQIIDVKPTTNVLQARLLYRVPWRPKDSIRFALGAGYLRASSGQLEVRHEQRTVEGGTQRVETLQVDVSGSGAIGTLETELLLNESVAIVGDIGYRYLNLKRDGYSITIAQVDRPSIDGTDPDDIPEGSDLSDASILRQAFIVEAQRLDQRYVNEFEIEDFDVDFSGIQANVGLRFYIF